MDLPGVSQNGICLIQPSELPFFTINGDITLHKSLLHYGEPSFLAKLGLPLQEGGIKSWS